MMHGKKWKCATNLWNLLHEIFLLEQSKHVEKCQKHKIRKPELVANHIHISRNNRIQLIISQLQFTHYIYGQVWIKAAASTVNLKQSLICTRKSNNSNCEWADKRIKEISYLRQNKKTACCISGQAASKKKFSLTTIT